MDLYEILRVDRRAESSEIYKAYLRRKTELGSVGNQGLSAEEKRKLLSDIEYAEKVLTDPARRAEYDRGLIADETMNNSVPPQTAHKVSLAKPQPEKKSARSQPQQELLPKASPPEPEPAANSPAEPAANSPAEPSSVGKTEDTFSGRYLITNAIAFVALLVLMIIFL
ncbi:MAG: DnaJ domain-containing protein [Oscillospiraceae bacterium]